MASGKKRQANYRARMLSAGKRQYSFWLTEEQAEEIRTYLAGEASLLTPAAPEDKPERAKTAVTAPIDQEIALDTQPIPPT